MDYIAKNVPLWSVTTWDKSFNGVDKAWQPKTCKYKYLLSDELDRINVGGDVYLLYTGKDVGFTTEKLAGDALCEGEIVSIPWGGTPSVKYYRGKFVTGDNRIATSNKPKELLNKYLYYYLKGHLREISSFYRGAGLKHPAMKDVLNMAISYPDVKTQQHIISQLDNLEQIIGLREQEIEQLNNLIKARFIEMFGDPESNPFGWDKKPLSSIIINANNGMARRGNDENGNIVLRLVELQDGYIDYSKPNRISLSDAEKRRYLLVDNDFLFARVNGNPDNVGRCAVFHDIGEEVYHNDHIIRVHFNETVLNGVFASSLINSSYGKRQLKNQIKTSAGQYTVSQDGIGAIIIILPPLEIQNQFAVFCDQIGKSKTLVQKALGETQLLFDSLMQEYFG